MATTWKELGEAFEQIASGPCVFQVRAGSVYVYVGENAPSENEKACFHVKSGDSFTYTGSNSVWARADGKYAAIVIDTEV